MIINGLYELTAHATQRLAQRNLTPNEVEIAVRYGQRYYRAQAQFFFLGVRDLPAGSEREWARLVGTTVVVSRDDHIATVYRHQRASARIKRKHVHRLHPSRRL